LVLAGARMSDTREAILEQLQALLSGVSGIAKVYRDRGDAGTIELPAIFLLDGSEDNTMADEAVRNKSVKFPGGTFNLKPDIVLIPAPRDDASNLTLDGVSAPIGPEISQWRMSIRAAIENDSTLISLLYPQGGMSFLGSNTDMHSESQTLLGMLLIRYSFRYWVSPIQP
jgi:hypothetical protein